MLLKILILRAKSMEVASGVTYFIHAMVNNVSSTRFYPGAQSAIGSIKKHNTDQILNFQFTHKNTLGFRILNHAEHIMFSYGYSEKLMLAMIYFSRNNTCAVLQNKKRALLMQALQVD